jgi:hypothetical protein
MSQRRCPRSEQRKQEHQADVRLPRQPLPVARTRAWCTGVVTRRLRSRLPENEAAPSRVAPGRLSAAGHDNAASQAWRERQKTFSPGSAAPRQTVQLRRPGLELESGGLTGSGP